MVGRRELLGVRVAFTIPRCEADQMSVSGMGSTRDGRPKTISDEAVKRATGKRWQEWFRLLDNAGAKARSHQEVVRLLHETHRLTSGWWCQMVTVTYEQARGRRVAGERVGSGFQVSVQKRLTILPRQAW